MVDYTYEYLFYEDSVDKQLKIEAEDGTVITNEDIVSESMKIDEGLCSEQSLTFGSCEASEFTITIANRFSSLVGQWIVVSITPAHQTEITGEPDILGEGELGVAVLGYDGENQPTVPFVIGTYKVQSDKPTADREYREIVAYDAMYDIINADSTDVAEWYNEIFPQNTTKVSLRNFRKSFLEHFDIKVISTSLVNDDIWLEKTISTSALSGQRVIRAICELNGVFGHITRDGKFEYIQLEPINESDAYSIPFSKTSDYEDFETNVIGSLQIRENDTDPGAIYGSGDNRYIIDGNFLLYGKTTSELITIAANLYPIISLITYRPASMDVAGNPCLEVGDIVHLSTKYQEIYTYILSRTLSGIQALSDSYYSNGVETYKDEGGTVDENIEQLRSRITEIQNEVDGTNEVLSIAVTQIKADYAEFLELEVEVANIHTLFAEYATIQELYVALATIEELYVTYEEVETLLVGYASIEDLEVINGYIENLTADIANITNLFADYATIEDLEAALATIGDLYVTYEEVTTLLADYASITDLDAVRGTITLLDSDVANIMNLLAGNAGVGTLDAIHLTTANAVIDEAVITEALINTVLAGIITSNIIYTDEITIMSENGGIVISGTTMQFSDSNGTVRLQLGEDADGNFTFVLYDETGTGIMIDSEGIHASAVPDGLIVDSMVADDAAISGYKLNIEEVTQILNEQGQLTLTAAQVTIDGETLDYRLTQITQQISDIESMGVESIVNYYALGSPDEPPCDPGESINNSILGEMILGEVLLGYVEWTTERLVAGEGQYLWYAQKITYVDGTVVWTTPTLITDDWIRSTVATTVTELSVVQGQIESKVWESDITNATSGIWEQIAIIDERYADIIVNLNSITGTVSELVTTESEHFISLSSDVSNITIELGNISSTVSSVQQSIENIESYAITNTTMEYYKSTSATECVGGEWSTTAPAAEDGYYIWMRVSITYGVGSESRVVTTDPICLTSLGEDISVVSIVPYYSVSGSPYYYQSHGGVDNPALVETAIVDTALVGITGEWTTEQPETGEYDYLWECFLVTFTNGDTTWTDPTCLTDVVVRDQISNLQESYSQIEQTINSITLTVHSTEGGALGSTASIVMTVGDSDLIANLDLSNVRQAFADDDSSIVISAGTILFMSNTFMVSSDNLLIEADGSIIASDGMFNGTITSYSDSLNSYGDKFQLTITNSNIRIYLNDVILWRISPVYSSGSANYVSILGREETCGAISFGFDNNNGATGYYFINNTQDPNGRSERHQFVESVYMSSSLRVNGTGYFNSSLYVYGSQLWVSGSLLVSSSATITGDAILDGNVSIGTLYSRSSNYIKIQDCLSLESKHIFMTPGFGITWTDDVKTSYSDSSYYFGQVYADTEGNFGINAAGYIYLNGSRYSSSDKSLKKNIKSLNEVTVENVYEKIDQLEPVEYEWNKENDNEHTHYGYIANDVQKVMPELVAEEEDGKLALAYDEIIPLLHLKIKQLESRIAQLEQAD